MNELVKRLLEGDRIATGRIISKVENNSPEKAELLSQLFPYTGKAFILGVTGPPGSGKSTLVDVMTDHFRERNLTVGVIAVDPTSPFSGGAILGDRIRMQQHALDEGVFIRSMGTRGQMGGLARATREAIKVLDAFGRDLIIVETVGVGQSELDIMAAADTTLVVLNPGTGDSIQAIKAGIMEIADIFIINKCDHDGADSLFTEVSAALDLNYRNYQEWRPPIIKTSAIDGRGISDLIEAVDSHREYAASSGEFARRRTQRFKAEITETVEKYLVDSLWRKVESNTKIKDLLGHAEELKLDPNTIALQILKEFD